MIRIYGGGVESGFLIDATLSENHSFKSEVTSYPVEDKSTITDHVRLLPDEVTISSIVSDAPFGGVLAERDPESIPSEEALAFLLKVRSDREPITISTHLMRYENMVMTNLDIPIDSNTGEALHFRATFTQVQLVTNERTTITVELPRSAAKQNRGNKASKTEEAGATPVPDEAKQRTSALYDGISSVKRFF